MMPIIRPMTIEPQPQTEYRSERQALARAQAELRNRKRARWRDLVPAALRRITWAVPAALRAAIAASRGRAFPERR